MGTTTDDFRLEIEKRFDRFIICTGRRPETVLSLYIMIYSHMERGKLINFNG